MERVIVAILLAFSFASSQEKPTAESILAQAIGQVKPCAFVSTREDLDKAHHVVRSVEETPKGDGTPVSLKLLFKAGRYDLELSQSGERIDFQHKKKDQIETGPDESRVYNWAMNKLDGHLVIDPDSLELKSVKAELPKEAGNVIGKFSEFTLDLEQEKVGERYQLKQMILETWFKYRDAKWIFFKTHEEHFRVTTRFSCGS